MKLRVQTWWVAGIELDDTPEPRDSSPLIFIEDEETGQPVLERYFDSVEEAEAFLEQHREELEARAAAPPAMTSEEEDEALAIMAAAEKKLKALGEPAELGHEVLRHLDNWLNKRPHSERIATALRDLRDAFGKPKKGAES